MHCPNCIPDYAAAQAFVRNWCATNPKYPDDFKIDLPDIYGNRIGTISSETVWLSETVQQLMHVCNVCGHKFTSIRTGRRRGVLIEEHRSLPIFGIFDCWQVTGCCRYSGETRQSAGYFFASREDIPPRLFELAGRYDPEASQECDAILTQARQEGKAFLHTDCCTLRQAALNSVGKIQ